MIKKSKVSNDSNWFGLLKIEIKNAFSQFNSPRFDVSEERFDQINSESG